MDADAAYPTGTFLELLGDEDRRALEERAGRRRFKAGATLTHEGGLGAEVLVLLEGRVKVSIDTPEGKEVVLKFSGPGELIGEFAVIDEDARFGTTLALEPVAALALSAPDFLGLIERRPGVALALLRNIVQRFRDADRLRIEFASAQTLGRVASRLAELLDRHGEPVDDGIAITLPITQEELAGWTGSSREAVAKALHTLRELDLIRTERRRIVVLDDDGLRRVVG